MSFLISMVAVNFKYQISNLEKDLNFIKNSPLKTHLGSQILLKSPDVNYNLSVTITNV